MKFNIQLSSDGIPSKYGNYFNIGLDETVDELIRYDVFSEQYTREELRERLKKMEVGYIMDGTSWFAFRITKKD